MFNSYNSTYRGGDVSNSLKINACSGGIYKTYKESWFERFNLQSEKANILFNNCSIDDVRTGEFHRKYNKFEHSFEELNYNDPKKEKKEIIVLQMIICGDMEVIAELIKKEDFDKYFQKEETNE